MASPTKHPTAATPKSKPTRRGRGRPPGDSAGGTQIRELILQATREVYATHGFHRSTVAQVLEAAQVSRPTFYKYFPDLPTAIDAVGQQANDQLRRAVASALIGSDAPETLLLGALDAYFRWCEEQGPMATMIYREINDTATPAHRHRLAVIGDFIVLLDHHRQRLGLPAADPLLVDCALRAVEHAASSAYFPTRQPADVVQRHRAVAEQILLALLAQAVPTRPANEFPSSPED